MPLFHEAHSGTHWKEPENNRHNGEHYLDQSLHILHYNHTRLLL